METVKKQLYYDSGEKLKEFYQLMEKGHWLYIIYLEFSISAYIYIHELVYHEVSQSFNFLLLQYPIDPCGSFFSPYKFSNQFDNIEQTSCWDFN